MKTLLVLLGVLIACGGDQSTEPVLARVATSSYPVFQKPSDAAAAWVIVLSPADATTDSGTVHYPDSVYISTQINWRPKQNSPVVGWPGDSTQIEWRPLTPGLQMLTWGWFRPTTTDPAVYLLEGVIKFTKNGVTTYYHRDTIRVVQP
jgi:hypothetical protein